jgi:ketosteroid isomerase-like protein
VVSENLDLVRSIYADWERGDFSRSEWADPEIEYVVGDGPEPGSWRGADAMREGWRDFLSAWAGYRVRVDEYRGLDDDRVLVLLHAAGHGKTSGLELGATGERGANVLQVASGKVTKLVVYFDRNNALADLGLEK